MGEIDIWIDLQIIRILAGYAPMYQVRCEMETYYSSLSSPGYYLLGFYLVLQRVAFRDGHLGSPTKEEFRVTPQSLEKDKWSLWDMK